MSEREAKHTTHLLRRIREGDAAAQPELLALVYAELRHLAGRQMARERPDHTLQPTALVHEAFLKLVDQEEGWNDRGHFLCAAARAMRNILVDHARARRTTKRGGDLERTPLDDVLLTYEQDGTDLLAVEDALTELARRDEELVRIVELRFYAGKSIPEIAEVLGMTARQVEHRWVLARSWLFQKLGRSGGEGEP